MTATPLSGTAPLGGAAPLDDQILIRHQVRVLDLAQGFFQAGAFSALLKLRVFERLDGAPKTAAQLAEEVGARADRVERLLQAGVAFRLLEHTAEGRYALTQASQAILAPSAGENYIGNWLRNLDFFAELFTRLEPAVREGGPVISAVRGHLGGDPALTREFILAMHNYAALRGKDLAAALDTTGCRTMLDVGAGPGTYSFLVGAANPALALGLVDLPGVLEVAREVAGRYALPNPVTYHTLDALKDPIPGQHDLVLVSNILHMLAEDESRGLIRKLFQNVAPGGSLVIQGMFLDDPETPVPQRWPVMVDLLSLCMTEAGRNHSPSEGRQWMEEAGFVDVEHRRMPSFSVTSYLRGWRRA